MWMVYIFVVIKENTNDVQNKLSEIKMKEKKRNFEISSHNENEHLFKALWPKNGLQRIECNNEKNKRKKSLTKKKDGQKNLSMHLLQTGIPFSIDSQIWQFH